MPRLRSAKLVRELERSFAQSCERGEFRVVHYSIQSDHVHLMVEASGRAALGRGMKSIGARFARAVNRVFRRTGRVLADRYHLHVLRSPTEVRNALRYVLLNGRRHESKLRRIPGTVRIDPASSGRWFDGWKRSTRVEPHAADARPRPVARPRTWLLGVGWRKRGLIDPADVPGAKRPYAS